ncbi:amyloid protein-binding protein 2 [Contarinia nasturtii]|uniref:amyloid protein-binding protein 2 n=1 Tax=Contarinia nasturtii TaxID=265458 RepID=UPI0012D4B94D|nr:amyloid protein-binding protein 2 [Contarinia nasturtii]XP_031628725.1 amyloid protein-binding protein 2 [Contarinia nasturtii]XP_031628726.1 amyloid protein-binding protein 2 [Contarinia nasturtii]XP_031628727.1 amyloid protein-binding protein 2 [Contarinia nasturtii]XP_031628729.1 amyloid protein-binding protein 2 [Contarinia nasturtii]
MASKSYYNPERLYSQCIVSYVKNLQPKTSQLDEIDGLQMLPPNILADIYLAMSESEDLRDILYNELSNLTIFMRLLKYAVARQKMIKCFSVLMCSGRQLSTEISSKFSMYTHHHFQTHYKTSPMKNSNHNLLMSRDMCLKQIENGMRLGTFLSESGWLQDSLKVLVTILNVINTLKLNYNSIIVKLDCLQRLLHAQVAFCCFADASKSQQEANDIISHIGIEKVPINLLVTYYKVLSMLYFAKSDYNLSYDWSVKALQLINGPTPNKIAIDVLRVAAKACVVKREFDKARILILKAVKMAGTYFGESHQKYADTLLDYGFFLLNVDDIVHSVQAYSRALDIKTVIHGNRNLAVATAEEDLSYALYVLEYSSGNFQSAREHICKSIDILRSLLPKDHLLLSSARRVKALILEEIALDNGHGLAGDTAEYQNLLIEAEELHQSALKITIDAFGEVNVQTAKHYGNLGRLYQSMAKYHEAEELHKRAIKIKSDLLGTFDYEVGLSIGHLASLYSYHMQKYREAEKLYLKSIAISLRLFGSSYSGLEYDYKGLCNVYEQLNDTDKYLEYSNILDTWRMIREGNLEVSTSGNELKEEITLDEVREKFFDLCSRHVAVVESDNN